MSRVGANCSCSRPENQIRVLSFARFLLFLFSDRKNLRIPAQNVGKKKRPHMSSKTIREDYHAVTSTGVNSLYFDGFDPEIGFDAATHEIVLFDNVTTTGGTFLATVQLLKRFEPACTISEAVVMWTEGSATVLYFSCVVIFPSGYEPFSSLSLHDGSSLAIVSLGGHIPIFKEHEIENGVALRPPQFCFRSSARFPTAYNPDHNIQFAVFENNFGVPAVAVVGPGKKTLKKRLILVF